MNIRFLGKLAQKKPALARFLEGIIINFGLNCIISSLTAVIAYLESGDLESLRLGLYTAVITFVIGFCQSVISAIGKWKRDLQKK